MVIYTLSNRIFSVYFPSTELSDAENKFSDSEILDFLSHSLGRKITNAEVTMFSGGNGLLFFVSLALKTDVYRFDDFENLLCAVAECADAASSLYFYNGSYYLFVNIFHDEAVILSEFGEKMVFSPELRLHITEHGKTILPSGAISKLKAVFCKN